MGRPISGRKLLHAPDFSLRGLKSRGRHYGLTSAMTLALFYAQGGRCAICEVDTTRLCIDHDHETGQVRGLLCVSCNAALGHMKDSPERLMAAAIYLTSRYSSCRLSTIP
jgi:hypothetical protein